ncbi:putative HD superfamily hydrolase [Candidatus Nitrososphaera evergladensis SR1]|uniref:Putative HD superfamily hydrolase n=1 Tax=Candidatus Nitrososphaera evergladensis SR1 TaxID=1459636 RepID=A0A075MQL9_9ARCH|nr:HD domain-containing protein [Candidatus Nitrososphaera evergladensis]AIF83162.1 putative HD superfamily hydrolase [Candidatus Nitrososphaera evergladensis SR1]
MLDDIKLEVERMLAGRDPGHDFAHVTRVYKTAERIGRKESADMEILLASALLHDIIVYPKGSDKRTKSADESAELAEKMLAARGWTKDRIDRVSYCIRVHSYSKNIANPEILEAKILQDADRLDALGAIGIARTFSVGGSEMRRFYNPEDPFCKTNRKPEDTRWTVDHFKAKLLKLENTMHTATAKKIASERTRFMEAFLAQLEKEISG